MHCSNISSRVVGVLALALWTLAASPAWPAPTDHAAPAKAESAQATSPTASDGAPAAHAAGAAPSPAPTPKLGPKLDGYFDLSVLRDSSRVAKFRLALPPLIVQLHGPQRAEIHITVEFGDESGVAELSGDVTPVMEDLLEAVSRFSMAQLIPVDGKQRLKSQMVRLINRRLKTARVRRIYFTDFRIGR